MGVDGSLHQTVVASTETAIMHTDRVLIERQINVRSEKKRPCLRRLKENGSCDVVCGIQGEAVLCPVELPPIV